METVRKVVREGADELTLRAEECDTLNRVYQCGSHCFFQKKKWGPPLVDADWYAFYQAILQRK